MSDRSTMASLERFAPWIAGVLTAAPVLITYFPPVGDVALHESAVGLLRHWGDARYVPPGVYELNLGLANQLVYLVMAAVAYVFPVALATKIVLAAAVFAFPVAVGRLADHLGVTRFAALAVAPLGLGWMFFNGLLANEVGLDLFVLALPSLDRFVERPDNRRLAVACVWMALLHFTHELSAMLAAGTLVLFTIASFRRWEQNVVRLFPVFVLGVLVASSFVLSIGLHAKERPEERGSDWEPTLAKLAALPDRAYGEWFVSKPGAAFLLGGCFLVIVLFGVERWRRRARAWPPAGEWLHAFRYEVLTAALVVLYFVAPARVGGTTLIYGRFAAPALVFLTLSACARGPSKRPWLAPRALACLAPLAAVVLTWPRFEESSRLFRGLDAMIAHMEPGSAVIAVHIGPTGPYAQECGNVDGHVVGALGGRSYFDYTTMEISPVHQRLEAQWDTSYFRIHWTTPNFSPTYDLTRYRYLLLHAVEPDVLDGALHALQPEGKLVAREQEWMLVESTLPVVPPSAPDEPTPEPAPITLAQRLWILSRGGGPPQ